MDWNRGSITGWSSICHATCLQLATYPSQSPSVFHETSPDLSSIPEVYHDLGSLFSKSRALSLPPHLTYDCAIKLLPGTTPPQGRLYSLTPCLPTNASLWISTLGKPLLQASSTHLPHLLGQDFSLWRRKMDHYACVLTTEDLMRSQNRYPLPLICSAFTTLQRATKLDLRYAYHLLRIQVG